MTGEIKAFISAYAKSLGITFAEAEEKVLKTGCVRINALRKYANTHKAAPRAKAPKAKKAAPKGTSIAKKKAAAKKSPAPKARKPRAPKAEVAAPVATGKVSAMDEGGQE
jgi:hypothetical protein